MNIAVEEILESVKSEMLEFAQALVRIKSFTGSEGDVVNFVKEKMLALGYDDVIVDKMGNVVGVMGTGETKIMYDGHLDTVSVDDASDWSVNPFGGDIIDGKLYGRGSSDMKCAVAAAVYAGYAIKKLGFDKGKTIYISASIMEEDCDGGAILHECTEENLKPDYVVICEPSGLRLAVGQRGRTSIRIDMDGVSCHASAPEKGVNPVYKMNPVIKRIESLNSAFAADKTKNSSVALTKIDSLTGSINTVPNKCSVYLDRRLAIGEGRQFIENEMKELVKDTDATWEFIQYSGKSWTGKDVNLDIFFPAWEISPEHCLTKAAVVSFEEVTGKSPEIFKWNFSTNGVASMGMLGIPTIGFGPSDGSTAHCRDEFCPVEDIFAAFKFYTNLPNYL